MKLLIETEIVKALAVPQVISCVFPFPCDSCAPPSVYLSVFICDALLSLSRLPDCCSSYSLAPSHTPAIHLLTYSVVYQFTPRFSIHSSPDRSVRQRGSLPFCAPCLPAFPSTLPVCLPAYSCFLLLPRSTVALDQLFIPLLTTFLNKLPVLV